MTLEVQEHGFLLENDICLLILVVTEANKNDVTLHIAHVGCEIGL